MNPLRFLPVTVLAVMLVGSSASKADDNPNYTCVISTPVSDDYYGSTLVVSGYFDCGYFDYGFFDASITKVEISVIGDGEQYPCFIAGPTLTYGASKCYFTATADPPTGFPSPGWYTVTVKGYATGETEHRKTGTKRVYAAGSGPPDTE
jgi:hypothetical protein